MTGELLVSEDRLSITWLRDTKKRTYDRLADETDGLQSGYSKVNIILVHKTQEDFNEIRPLVVREFNNRYGLHNLGSDCSNRFEGRTESHERVLFDLLAGFLIESQPAI